MVLSDVSVKRPVFATVVSLLLIAFGVLSFWSLPLRELPDVDPPIVSIQTIYRGAAADVVETRITQIVEDSISGIEGIRTISSSSRDGRSDVTIEFELARDIEAAANDIRSAVSRIASQLPDEAEAARVTKMDSDGDSIVWLSVVSDRMSNVELSDYVERNVVDRLAVVNGVARVRSGGLGLRYAMRVWLDRKGMAARGITVADIESALRQENVELPAGKIESEQQDFSVRLQRSYATPKDFASLPLAEGEDGHIVRLGEVADVELGTEDERYFFRGNKTPRVGMGIVKQSRANTLDVVTAVRAEMDRIRMSLPDGMRIFENYDSSVFIQEAIEEVYFTLSVAMGLVIFVIYLFLGSVRSAIIPAVTVPVSLIASFSAMFAFGLSINLMTLLALVLSIGLVVDDSIVVLENVQRRVELGEKPLAAAYRGARQVGFAVVATTAVLMAVFLPIMFLSGDIGRLFAELAIAVSAAVFFSSIVALTLTAMMCSKLLRPESQRVGLAHTVDEAFKRLQDQYMIWLAIALAHPKRILGGVIGVLVLVGLLFQVMPSEFAPPEDRGSMFGMMRGPPGASYDYSVKHMRLIEDVIEPYTQSGEISHAMARVPGSFGATADYSGGFLMIMLDHWDNRDRSGLDLTAELNQKLGEIPGVRTFVFMRSSFGWRGGGGSPVAFVIQGPDYESLAAWRDVILEKARGNPGLVGVDADFEEKTPQLRVEIDRTRAADLGVPVETIGNTLSTMLGSRRVTTFQTNGEEYDVILQMRRSDRQEPNDLTNNYVRSARTGQLIPLSTLVKLRDEAGANTLRRFNRLRAVTITANLAPGYRLGDALDFLEETARTELPDAAVFDFRGESRTFKESGSAIYFTFGMALLVVFLVLAAQFESFIHPLIIMLTVPVAILGALIGLLAVGGTLNIYSQIGIIILIGLAAKNGILIVEFANQMRDAGRSFDDALMLAARTRLRPIIMTGISTAIGALPLVLASGAGSASRTTIGVVIFSGVLLATMLTVFIVPVFYKMIGQYTEAPGTVARRLTEQENEVAGGAAPGE